MKKRRAEISEWGVILCFIGLLTLVAFCSLGDKMKEMGLILRSGLQSTNVISACNSSGGVWGSGVCTCTAPASWNSADPPVGFADNACH